MAGSLAVLVCILTGYAVVCLLWPEPERGSDHLVVKASLAGPCGIGIFSLVYFVWRLSAGSRPALVSADLTILLFLLLSRRLKSSSGGLLAVRKPLKQRRAPNWITVGLIAGFWGAMIAALYTCIRRSIAAPNGGGWDAFAIWNLRARFLFLGGPHWRDGFSNVIHGSHPDYPLLLPAAIAHFWTYLQRDAAFVPAIIGLLFAFSTVGLLYSAMRILRGRTQALLAGIVLLATPSFLREGTSQYADIPLAFFMLATFVALSLRRWLPGSSRSPLVLAGITTGFAAWTKNEGLLFLCAFLLVYVGQVVKAGNWRTAWWEIAPALLGMLPAFAVLAYFKVFVAPRGDLFSPASSMLSKLVDPSRYWLILRWFGKEGFLFGGWTVIPLTVVLAIYAKLLGKEVTERQARAASLPLLTLVITLAGYFAVYVITPYDLRWHLRYSLDRLFLQLWPSALFIFFVVVRTPEEWLARIRRSESEEMPIAPAESTIDKAAA